MSITAFNRTMSKDALRDPADAEAVRRYLRHLKLQGRSQTTIDRRRYAYARLARALPCTLLDASADVLYEWRAGLSRLRESSVAIEVRDVRVFYEFCAEFGLTDGNPARKIPVPSLPQPKPHPMAFGDWTHALSTASPTVRIWLYLGGGCGLRAKEIALLDADCIRLRDEQPHLLIKSSATKGKRERIVPLPEWLVAELKTAGLPASGPVFRDANGQQVTPAFVSRKCNQHLHECGIPDPLHHLRHRFITAAFAVNRNIRVAQDLAGHASVNTTAAYAAVDGKEYAATVDAIPAPTAIRQEAS